MSTCVHDLAAAAVTVAGFNPGVLTVGTEGPAVDLLAGDGPCFAVQHVGAVSGTSPLLTGRVEQSADNALWTVVPGAAFAPVAAANNVQVIRFTRTARYVRWTCDVTGTSPQVTVGVVFGQQRKTI